MPGTNESIFPRASLSYVTGTHAFKVGYNDQMGYSRGSTQQVQPAVSYRFNNGIPNQLTEVAFPFERIADVGADMGVYAQDKWTINGLTLSYGLRYDYFTNSYPEQSVGPAPLAPNRNFTFSARPDIDVHLLTRRGDEPRGERPTLNLP